MQQYNVVNSHLTALQVYRIVVVVFVVAVVTDFVVREEIFDFFIAPVIVIIISCQFDLGTRFVIASLFQWPYDFYEYKISNAVNIHKFYVARLLKHESHSADRDVHSTSFNLNEPYLLRFSERKREKASERENKRETARNRDILDGVFVFV